MSSSALMLAGCGGGGSSAPAPTPPPAPTTPPPPANSAPSFTSPSAISVSENDSSIATITATDAQGSTITFSLTGADAGLFQIGAMSGALSSLAPLDFENPTDTGGDNVYNVTVNASDGQLSSSQNVAITVSNVANDGIVRILGAAEGDLLGAAMTSAADYDKDGANDLYIGMQKSVPTVPQSDSVAYFVFASALQTETAKTLALSSLTINDGVDLFVNGLTAAFSGSIFAPTIGLDGAAPSPASATGPFHIVSHPVPVGSGQTVTAFVQNNIADIKAAGGQIDLAAAPLFGGLRSSRNNLSSTVVDRLSIVGDMDGDTVSDVVGRTFSIERNSGGGTTTLTQSFIFFSGTELLTGAQGVFDAPEVQAGSAVVIVNDTGFTLAPTGAGGDIDGDGAADLLLVGSSGGTNTLFIVSGAAIFGDADGFINFSQLPANAVYRVSSATNTIGTAAALGDFDGDGKSDLAFVALNAQADDRVFVLYNDAIALDVDQQIVLEDVQAAQLSEFNPPVQGVQTGFVVVSDVTGDGADEILFQSLANRGQSSVSAAYLASGAAFTRRTAGVITFSPTTIAGRAARLLAPALDSALTLPSDGFGATVARLGDIDGDNAGEVAISAPLSGRNDGAAASDAVGAVYVIPTRRLRAAMTDGATIDLGVDF